MIDKEAVLVLLKQILAARPQLKDTIRSSREFLFGVIARIYILDEMRREFAFEREEISVLFDSLLEPEFIDIPDKRLHRFFEQIMAASKEVVREDAFRQAVAAALLEAVKNKGTY